MRARASLLFASLFSKELDNDSRASRVLPESRTTGLWKVMRIFLNFLILSLSLDCLFASVAARLSQLQLVIHVSSATRRVPCVLIRANSLVSFTQVGLKHWSDLLPGCTLTPASSGNYYYSFTSCKNTQYPPASNSFQCTCTLTHTLLAEGIHTPLCWRIFSTPQKVLSTKTVKHMHVHWESKGRDSVWGAIVLPDGSGCVWELTFVNHNTQNNWRDSSMQSWVSKSQSSLIKCGLNAKSFRGDKNQGGNSDLWTFTVFVLHIFYTFNSVGKSKCLT